MEILNFNQFGRRILDLHGYTSDPDSNFHPWLKHQLQMVGYIVDCPKLPNTNQPNVNKQVDFLLKNYNNKYNIIVGHSLGGCVAMKFLEKYKGNIDTLILVASFMYDEDIKDFCDWKFDFDLIKSKCKEIYILKPIEDTEVTVEETEKLANALDTKITYIKTREDHACGEIEPEILKYIN